MSIDSDNLFAVTEVAVVPQKELAQEVPCDKE